LNTTILVIVDLIRWFLCLYSC